MQVAFVKPGNTVICGTHIGKFLRMTGSDALIELDSGRRVVWSGTTEVETLSDVEEIRESSLPRLETELIRLESFTEGKYSKLGVLVTTACVELSKVLHSIFAVAALGPQPEDAVLCRRCNTKLCVRADHIFWGTRSDCQRDMVLRGVAKPSGKHVTALTVAVRLVKLKLRITRLKSKLISQSP